MNKSNDPRYNFNANPSVDELIAQQGKGPIHDPKVLLGEFWPADEPVEHFLAVRRRGHWPTNPDITAAMFARLGKSR
jgi:hypothetical protein